MINKLLFILAICLGFSFLDVSSSNTFQKADMVIYSCDRPLQLYAFLESVHKYVTGLGNIKVIYRTTNHAYEIAYNEVQKDFNHVVFMQQGSNPNQDFKQLTLHAAFSSIHDYIIFSADDIIVKDFIDVSHDILLLECASAYGFYYRLGKNISYCYMAQRAQSVPSLYSMTDVVFVWDLDKAEHDWGFPNNIDMTLYRKKDIVKFFYTAHYDSPTSLVNSWFYDTHKVCDRTGLCYEQSKIINIPFNRVQNFANNNHMGVNQQYLLESFNEGKKFDISVLFRVNNISPHQACLVPFINRS